MVPFKITRTKRWTQFYFISIGRKAVFNLIIGTTLATIPAKHINLSTGLHARLPQTFCSVGTEFQVIARVTHTTWILLCIRFRWHKNDRKCK
jgi:hypothetical protein